MTPQEEWDDFAARWDGGPIDIGAIFAELDAGLTDDLETLFAGKPEGAQLQIEGTEPERSGPISITFGLTDQGGLQLTVAGVQGDIHRTTTKRKAETMGVDWLGINQFVGSIYPDWTVHPGQTLTDFMNDAAINDKQLAALTETSLAPHVVTQIREGERDIDVGLALRLETATEIKAEIWLHLQMTYDLHHARASR